MMMASEQLEEGLCQIRQALGEAISVPWIILIQPISSRLLTLLLVPVGSGPGLKMVLIMQRFLLVLMVLGADGTVSVL